METFSSFPNILFSSFLYNFRYYFSVKNQCPFYLSCLLCSPSNPPNLQIPFSVYFLNASAMAHLTSAQIKFIRLSLKTVWFSLLLLVILLSSWIYRLQFNQITEHKTHFLKYCLMTLYVIINPTYRIFFLQIKKHETEDPLNIVFLNNL